MSKIDIKITSSKFELIRDKIAYILADELANQAILHKDNLFCADVWVERFIPFGHIDLPAINVFYQRTTFEQQTPVTNEGEHYYNIDFHLKAESKSYEVGDKISSLNLHKLIGVSRAILEHPYYIYLDFGNNFGIANTHVTDIKIAEPERRTDGLHLISGRIIFKVRCNEFNEQLEGLPSEGFDTQIKLNETDKGYKIVI